MSSKLPVDLIARLHSEGAKPAVIVQKVWKQTGVKMSAADVKTVTGALQAQAKELPEVGPLLDFIPSISPRFMKPRHLAPIAEQFEQIGKKPLRIVAHAPPRHSKTELVLHTIAHGLRKDPTGVWGYASYGADLTYSKSTRCRDLAKRAGVRLSREAAKEWRTTDQGGLIATSTGGPLTGHGITRCMFVDDAYKNRLEAESKRKRQVIWDWFSDVVMTRIEPGASVVIFMVRWNQDDLAGRALREIGKHKRGPNGERPCGPDCPGCGPNPIDGFEEISLPAIDMNGAALWPEVWPLAALESKKRSVTEYTWLSQYQGTPRQRGSNVFEGLTFYDPKEKPKAGFSISIGIDLSYTESTSADWAVAVVLMKYGTQFWVLEVLRDQTTAPKFAQKLKALRKRYKGAPMYSIYYGPEKGSIDFMRTLGIPIKGLKRPGDKFIRSQPTAAAWNDGRISVPMVSEGKPDPEWLDPFIEVVVAFTGVKDDIDDDVDALVAALEGSGGSTARQLEETKEIGEALALSLPGDDISGWGSGGSLFE